MGQHLTVGKPQNQTGKADHACQQQHQNSSNRGSHPATSLGAQRSKVQ